jgi:hypothetical protein
MVQEESANLLTLKSGVTARCCVSFTAPKTKLRDSNLDFTVMFVVKLAKGKICLSSVGSLEADPTGYFLVTMLVGPKTFCRSKLKPLRPLLNVGSAR